MLSSITVCIRFWFGKFHFQKQNNKKKPIEEVEKNACIVVYFLNRRECVNKAIGAREGRMHGKARGKSLLCYVFTCNELFRRPYADRCYYVKALTIIMMTLFFL